MTMTIPVFDMPVVFTVEDGSRCEEEGEREALVVVVGAVGDTE